MNPAAALLGGLADLALPPLCPACGKGAPGPEGLCAACAGGIEPVPPLALPGLEAHGLARHAGAVASCIRALKYRRDWAAGDCLARLLTRRAPPELLAWADIICPVPLHGLRLWLRGFNQAAWLAQALDKGKLRPELLLRTRRTRPQARLGAAQRRANVEGAFALNPRLAALAAGRRVLVIDDVLTTGATLGQCAAALAAGGAAGVKALTISRALESDDHDA